MTARLRRFWSISGRRGSVAGTWMAPGRVVEVLAELGEEGGPQAIAKRIKKMLQEKGYREVGQSN